MPLNSVYNFLHFYHAACLRRFGLMLWNDYLLSFCLFVLLARCSSGAQGKRKVNNGLMVAAEAMDNHGFEEYR